MSGFVNQANGHLMRQNMDNAQLMGCMNGMHLPFSSPVKCDPSSFSHLPSSCHIAIPDPVFRNGRKRSHDSLLEFDVKKSRCQEKDSQSHGAFAFQGAFSWSDGNGTPVSRPVLTPHTPPALPLPSFPLSTSYLEHQFTVNAECHYNRSLMEEIILEAHGC